MPKVYGSGEPPVALPPATLQRAVVRSAIQAGLISSQGELARRMRTTEGNVSRWLHGRQPRPRYARAWADLLDDLILQLTETAKLPPQMWSSLAREMLRVGGTR